MKDVKHLKTSRQHEGIDHNEAAHTHQHEEHSQENNHEHGHSHDHSHGKLPIILYLIGLTLAIVSLVMGDSVLSNILFVIASLTAGYHVVLLEGIGETIRRTKASKRLTPNSHVLMGLAAVGATLLGNYWEATLLILIFAGAHFLEDYAEGRSQREISQLIALTPNTARLLDEAGNVTVIDVSELKIGDSVQILNGDQVPIDGKVIAGNTSIDESSINGESIPAEKQIGDEVFASTINGTGTITIEVTKANEETIFAKIISLVSQNQANQTKAASIIQRFEPRYVNFVIVSVILFVIVNTLMFQTPLLESVQMGLVLLVAASPCALAAATVSVTLSTTSSLARKGVLSKGSVYLSQLANVQAIAFDKTGTLTVGKPEVVKSYFVKEDPVLIDILVAMERQSNHPLATAILEYYTVSGAPLELDVTNQIGTGLMSQYAGKNYRIGKPSSFEKVKAEILDLQNKWSKAGQTVIFLAEDEEVVAAIGLMDVPNEQAQATIDYFNQAGVHTTLITGDSEQTGQAIGQKLGLKEVFANVLPEDKSRLVSELKAKQGVTAMVGDGVNDAPALVQADIGLAMGEGTDVAIEVSDIVLMRNDLSKLVQTHRIAKKMNRVIWQNIIFSMAVVVFLIAGAVLGFSDIAISVVIHEGSTLVVILNGLRLLK